MNGGAPAFDRFAHWSRATARAALAAIMVMIAAAVWTAPDAPIPPAPASQTASAPAGSMRDRDTQLYQRIAQRVAAGDNYYTAAIDEQRAGNYPVRPGFAVRLPTLAFVTAWLGTPGLFALAVLLALATLAAWWRRLAEEPGGRERRLFVVLLIAIGAIVGLKMQYILVHELWAGLLLALAGAIHRPGHWRAAWLLVALAVAIREHALPFVLLLAAFAAWRRDWRELAAWLVLVALFAVGLVFHLHAVGEHLLASDRPSPSWMAFRGLGGLTGNIIESSILHLLPFRLAAVLTVLPLAGWAGWKSPTGVFYTLLLAGYGVLFMIAGRSNNFYWALMVTPVWFAGYAFLPMALRSLLASARGARS